MRFSAILLAMGCLYYGQVFAAPAQPQFINSSIKQKPTDLTGLVRLRFLTTTDFAPFNYLNTQGQLNGYNIDLARALCRELKLENICQIEALPWNELQAALDKGEGEAIIAGLTPTKDNRTKYDFSRPYLKFPARFIALKTVSADMKINDSDWEKPVGLIANSKHADVFQKFFPDFKVQNFEDHEEMLKALQQQEIAAIFDDGLALAFMLEDEEGHNCCHFVGKAYYSPQLDNNQMTITVTHNNKRLTRAFDYALSNLEKKGALNEIYMRHFPVSFY
ncbi:transporter substrate-binding domain-containing protein [Paenochrobactrum sp. BZR 588]|uniref:transporter substrate-binding domain-containing protein n=1 Tax=unclassified Paenochrobactrum TaxID=2639760 RepID=UPI0038533A62